MAGPDQPEDEDHPAGQPNTGAPRWAIVLGIVLIVAVLVLMIALHLSGAIGRGVH